jgi:S2P endopeptidase
LITHFDDIPIGGKADFWASYLNSQQVGDIGKGWCMDKLAYRGNIATQKLSLALSQPPCNPDNGFIAFETVTGTATPESRCLAPHPILDIPSHACPCPTARYLCVRPAAFEKILRINVNGPKEGQRSRGEVILWSGEREEVFDSVEVGIWGARGWTGGVHWAAMFIE